MQFRILAGSHSSSGPGQKLYRAGEVIDSDEDLCAIFVNKFERVDPKPKTPVKSSGRARAPFGQEIKDKAAKDEAALAAAEKANQDDEPKREMERGPQASKAALDKQKEDQEADEDELDPSESVGSLGVNCTDKFDKAKDADLSVWVKRSKYFITDSQNTDKALNDKPLTKVEAQKFIDSMLEEG